MIASHPASFQFRAALDSLNCLVSIYVLVYVYLISSRRCSISDLLSTTGPMPIDCVTLGPSKPPSWSIAIVVDVADQVYTN
jgi:hypothetical protein